MCCFDRSESYGSGCESYLSASRSLGARAYPSCKVSSCLAHAFATQLFRGHTVSMLESAPLRCSCPDGGRLMIDGATVIAESQPMQRAPHERPHPDAHRPALPPHPRSSPSAPTPRPIASSTSAACASKKSWARDMLIVETRGAARARRGRVHRHQSSAAPGAPQAAARDPRRSGGVGRTTSSSPTTSSRTPISRPAACCRCARTPAPPSSWVRRAAWCSPTAATRARSPKARATRT